MVKKRETYDWTCHSEAAMMDGASFFRIWWCITLPLVKSTLITVAIFSFTGAWNDLLGPLLYLSDENLYTLQLGLQTFKGSVQTQWNYLMAMSVMVLIPTVLTSSYSNDILLKVPTYQVE